MRTYHIITVFAITESKLVSRKLHKTLVADEYLGDYAARAAGQLSDHDALVAWSGCHSEKI